MIKLNVVVFVITGDGRVEGLVPRVQRQERGGRDWRVQGFDGEPGGRDHADAWQGRRSRRPRRRLRITAMYHPLKSFNFYIIMSCNERWWKSSLDILSSCSVKSLPVKHLSHLSHEFGTLSRLFAPLNILVSFFKDRELFCLDTNIDELSCWNCSINLTLLTSQAI